MTSVNALTVILEKDTSEYVAKHITEAIKMIKGVLNVVPEITLSNIDIAISEERVRQELAKKLFDVLYSNVESK